MSTIALDLLVLEDWRCAASCADALATMRPPTLDEWTKAIETLRRAREEPFDPWTLERARSGNRNVALPKPECRSSVDRYAWSAPPGFSATWHVEPGKPQSQLTPEEQAVLHVKVPDPA